MTIVTRASKGAALSHAEGDENITDLDTRAKLVGGVAPAAVAGSRFISDGAGGGEFIRIQGWGHYADAKTTVGTPSQSLVSGTRAKFTIDGGQTTLEKLPSDASNPLWNVSTNKIVPIATFDTYNIRVAFAAQNYSGAAPYLLIELDIGGALGVIWRRTVALLKGGAEDFIEAAFPAYAGSTFFANGGDIYLTYTGTADCDIYASQILLIRESKNYV